ncbi:hybrid sensor histidine kinase/response regulator, partial [bacterium]|nr:hybrid sensor histidine kinase/response regulator [bacterium]
KKQITLARNIPMDLPPIAGDEHRLQQAFFNIMFNAIQALETVENRPRLITVTAGPDDFKRVSGEIVDGIQVQIADTGPGIDDDTKAKIFNPFFSTKGPTGGKNIGLGLSILHEVVSGHDGYIQVDSEVGKGTVFSVYLPILTE